MMNTMMLIILPAIFVLLISMPFLTIARRQLTGAQAKNRIFANLGMFAGVCVLLVAAPLTGAFAQETAAVVSIMGTNAQGMGFIAAALVTGLAAIGAGIAIAAAAPAAIGAVSEDPKSFGKAIIFVVLGEGIAIYGLLISILIINKL